MSLTRRLAAGLPAAGATIFAALALSGAPASAASQNVTARVVEPAVMATPCVGNSRDCPKGYGETAGGTAPTGTAATGPTGDSTPTGDTGPTADTDEGPTRGQPGYGGESPATTPPTGDTDTVPPGGDVSPTTVSPTPSETYGGKGVSPASTLPLTGAPSAITVGLGAVLVGGGIFAIWFSRRRSA